MRRPSRGFVVAAVLAIAVAMALFHRWQEMRAPKPWDRPAPPDVWEREDLPGDLRQSPDGPAISGWTYSGRGQFENAPRKDSKDFVTVMPADAPKPYAGRAYVDRLTGVSPMERLQWDRESSRNLYRRRDPVTTASGRWWVYSTKWWLPAQAPPADKR